MPTEGTEPKLSGESLRAKLAPFQLFKTFDEAEWKALLEAVANPMEEIEVRPYLKEGVIRRKGEFDLSFCIVLKGSITLMRKLPGEPAQKSATFAEGEFYGEECALSGLQRYVDVRAAGGSQVLCVSPTALKYIDSNEAARKLIKQQYNQRAIAEVCEDLGLFAEIPMEVLRKLAEACEEPLKIPTGGQIILQQDQLANALHVIRSGFVEAFYKRKEDNTIRVVSYLRAGDFFGETLLENKPLQWSLRSADRCEIIRIPGDQLHKIAGEYPRVALRVHEALQLRERLEAKLTDSLAEEIERFGEKNLIDNDALMLMDLDLCVKCDCCVQACESLHGESRLIRNGIHIDQYLIPSACRHCDDPKCMTACPTGAVERRPRGEIYFRYDLCIGCSNCQIACPYDNIAMIDTDTFDRAQRHKASVLHDDKIFRPNAVQVPVTPHSDLETRFLSALFSSTSPAAAAPRPVPAVPAATGAAAAIPPQFPIKCDLCDGLPFMGCVHNCPTGAAIRINPETIFDHKSAKSRVERGGKVKPPRRGISALFAIVIGGLAIDYSTWIAEKGKPAGAYETGLLTLGLFLLPALYSLRKRKLWFSVRWLRASRVFGERVQHALRFLDRLRTWRFAHIALGVVAAAAFWAHLRAGHDLTGRMNALEEVLTIAVALVIASGYLGTVIQDFLPRLTARNESREVRLEDVASRLKELENQEVHKDIFLGRSRELARVYLDEIGPLLKSPEPRWKLWRAILTHKNASATACARAWSERHTIPSADLGLFHQLLDMGADKVDLEQNRLELLISTRWLRFHIGLTIAIAVLVVFHVLAVLYLWWP
jgi:Fe-S-cluster-containing dehydrogenase component/CRP-like cAMP-binding protein